MTRQNPFARVFLGSLILAAVLVLSSCENSAGIGIGFSSPSVWGGGSTSRPPIFVGGPSS
jgi:hypothetical protein